MLETIPSNSTYKEDQFNTNLDVKLNNANRFFGKYFFAANRTNQALYDQFGDGNPLQAPGWPTEEDVDQRLLSVGVTSVISSHLLNEVRFGWSKIYGPGNPSQPITSSQLGIESPLSSLFPGMPTISFTNMFTLGPSPLGINYAATNTYSGGDMMTWTKGRAHLQIRRRIQAAGAGRSLFRCIPQRRNVLSRAAPLPSSANAYSKIFYPDCNGCLRDRLGH